MMLMMFRSSKEKNVSHTHIEMAILLQLFFHVAIFDVLIKNVLHRSFYISTKSFWCIFRNLLKTLDS